MSTAICRRFTLVDQTRFAELSGDFNPIHIDPHAARRLMYGEPVVHGVNGVLWALAEWGNAQLAYAGDASSNVPDTLHVLFLRPLLLDTELALSFVQTAQGEWKLQLWQHGQEATRVKIRQRQVQDASQCAQTRLALMHPVVPPLRTPVLRSASELSLAFGHTEVYVDDDQLRQIYPSQLLEYWGVDFVADLLACTRVVGMHCPGLNSLFSELNWEMIPQGRAHTPLMRYETSQWDDRFGKLILRATGVTGDFRLTVFSRPEQVEQASFQEVSRHLTAEELRPDVFAHQRALVVGGSRGLGEICAKLLLAGGAKVHITYAQGETEARAWIAQTSAARGRVSCSQYDVTSPPQTDLGFLNFQPSHVYYFATPFIFNGIKAQFSIDKWRRFQRYYVEGFAQLIEQLMPCASRRYFYPSTVALDDPQANMMEYALAKMAGEKFCELYALTHPDYHFYAPRLPRLATDQTVSITLVKNQDPLQLLGYLRQFDLGQLFLNESPHE